MKSKALQVFDFEDQPIRTIELDGELKWVATDICKALGIANTKQALDRIDGDDVCQTYTIDSLGREQMTNIINESGLYSLILGSEKPEAKRFKKWVTSEVLPSIRKTGKYSVTPSNLTFSVNGSMAEEFDGALRLATIIGLTGNQAIIAANRAMQNLHGVDCFTMIGNPAMACDVQDIHLRATDVSERLGIPRNKVNKLAVKHGLLTKERDFKGRLHYRPTETGKEFCLLKDVSIEGKKVSEQQLVYFTNAIDFFKQHIN